MVPDGRTVLRRGDDLLVVTPRKLREATEERLRTVSRSGSRHAVVVRQLSRRRSGPHD